MAQSLFYNFMMTNALDKHFSFFKQFLINNQTNSPLFISKAHSHHHIARNTLGYQSNSLNKGSKQHQQRSPSKMANFYLINKKYIIDKKINKNYISLMNQSTKLNNKFQIVFHKRKQRRDLNMKTIQSNSHNITSQIFYNQNDLTEQKSQKRIDFSKDVKEMYQNNNASSLLLTTKSQSYNNFLKNVRNIQHNAIKECQSSKLLCLSNSRTSKTPLTSSRYLYLTNKFYNNRKLNFNKFIKDKTDWQNKQRQKQKIDIIRIRNVPIQLEINKPFFIKQVNVADKLRSLKRKRQRQLNINGFKPLGYSNLKKKIQNRSNNKNLSLKLRQNQTHYIGRSVKKATVNKLQRCKTQIIPNLPLSLDFSQSIQPWQTDKQPHQNNFY